jgi:acetyltransferase-like isoleucine patch superfamily enzyme
VGHGVMFINDRHPSIVDTLAGTWKKEPSTVCRNASIGSGAVIMAGVTIGAGALVGAGAVVTHDVAYGTTVAGVPARLLARRWAPDSAPELSPSAGRRGSEKDRET